MVTLMIGKCGLYQWFEEDGIDLIHPDNLEGFRKLMPNGKVFKCIDEKVDFITLQYGKELYNVNPKLFKIVSIGTSGSGIQKGFTGSGRENSVRVGEIF